MEKCYGREGKERWLSGLRIVLVLGVEGGACTNEDETIEHQKRHGACLNRVNGRLK